MKSVQLNLQSKLRFLITMGLVCSMLLPVAAQAWSVLSNSQTCHVLAVDHQEESQKEEQKEDNTKDDKIEARYLNVNDQLLQSCLQYALTSRLAATTQVIVEIPIPPPELV